jgi:hypothetical protein
MPRLNTLFCCYRKFNGVNGMVDKVRHLCYTLSKIFQGGT